MSRRSAHGERTGEDGGAHNERTGEHDGAHGERTGARSGAPFRHRIRVRYAECDRQGHVFNSHYFGYFDVALTELWRTAIGYYDLMIERGVDLVVGEASARYLQAARFDDEIDVETAIERLGTSGITTRFRVLRYEALLVEGRLRHVCVDAGTLTRIPIPDWLREALAPWVVSPEPVSPEPVGP